MNLSQGCMGKPVEPIPLSPKFMFLAWFQVSAAKQMTTALFCVIMQREVVIADRRFGTTYRSNFQGSGTDRLSRNLVRKYHYSLHNNTEERSSRATAFLNTLQSNKCKGSFRSFSKTKKSATNGKVRPWRRTKCMFLSPYITFTGRRYSSSGKWNW